MPHNGVMQVSTSKHLRLRFWIAAVTLLFFGVILGWGLSVLLRTLPAVRMKLGGAAQDCSWSRTLSIDRDSRRFLALQRQATQSVAILGHDEALGIDLLASPGRVFWIKHAGQTMDGRKLLSYLLAEHDWMEEMSSESHVRPGDIVLDCGAHVGVFTAKALARGAARVVAIEPDPVHVECLRRNLHKEIAQGRVTLLPEGVWSQEGRITLFAGVENSGGNSMVEQQQGGATQVSVTTIDRLVQTLQLPRVDFIKMDIEGAERHALRGALETLRKFRPRLMIDSYHLPDDMRVLPAIIRSAHSDYEMVCGPCGLLGNRVIPHVTFYR